MTRKSLPLIIWRLRLVLLSLPIVIGVSVAPSHGDVLVDRPPNGSNGAGSDTGWTDVFGDSYWEQAADSFQLSSPATLSKVVWYGCYGDDIFSFPPPYPPSGDETMRVRLYDSRPSDGLPGSVIFEESYLNPSREATGARVGLPTYPPEYAYQVLLSKPVLLQDHTKYWLEIVQLDDENSLFRWETSSVGQGPIAVVNEHLTDWSYVPDWTGLAYKLISVPEPATSLPTFAGATLAAMIRGRKRGPTPPNMHSDRRT